MKTKTQLTEKETKLFNRIGKGIDQPHEGWLHDITAIDNTITFSKSTSGLVSSLVKKGLIKSTEDYELDGCYWVKLTEKGIKLYNS